MPLPLRDRTSLFAWLAAADLAGRWIYGADAKIELGALQGWSSLQVDLDRLAGASVLLAVRDQLAAALAMVDLDAVARRLVLCPPDLAPQHVPGIIEAASVGVIVSDRPVPEFGIPNGVDLITCGPPMASAPHLPQAPYQTEWVLLTSGTTGAPKLVVHTLASLTGAFRDRAMAADRVVWSTFYDIRRYGGLQIFLRSVLGGGSLVLSSTGEPTSEFLARAGKYGVTHISGTPSHWRRALMSGTARRIAPRYVRLSGEIADQTILDRLKTCYPAAAIGHAFASTEAGVAFEVNDGFSGFPADLVDNPKNGLEIRVEDGTLRLRSNRMARHYLGAGAGAIAGADGFIDTTDVVERRGDRYHFAGRRGGVINVGGSKVYPEEVEVVINRHPEVQLSVVKGRNSPITGAIVVAEVVVAGFETPAEDTPEALEKLKAGILELCRQALPAYKVPAILRIVSSLDIAASGKLARRDA